MVILFNLLFLWGCSSSNLLQLFSFQIDLMLFTQRGSSDHLQDFYSMSILCIFFLIDAIQLMGDFALRWMVVSEVSSYDVSLKRLNLVVCQRFIKKLPYFILTSFMRFNPYFFKLVILIFPSVFIDSIVGVVILLIY